MMQSFTLISLYEAQDHTLAPPHSVGANPASLLADDHSRHRRLHPNSNWFEYKAGFKFCTSSFNTESQFSTIYIKRAAPQNIPSSNLATSGNTGRWGSALRIAVDVDSGQSKI